MAKPGRKRVLAGREAEVLAAYRDGTSITELCARFGVTRHRIRPILDDAGISRPTGRPRALVAEHVPAIVAAYEAGETMSAIGRRLGVTHHVVRRTLEDHHVHVDSRRRGRPWTVTPRP